MTQYFQRWNKEFHSMVDFLSWKEEEETSSYSCYVQPKGGVENSEATKESSDNDI